MCVCVCVLLWRNLVNLIAAAGETSPTSVPFDCRLIPCILRQEYAEQTFLSFAGLDAQAGLPVRLEDKMQPDQAEATTSPYPALP